MGWVSYLEDINERLGNDLVRFRNALNGPEVSGLESRRRAEALLRACEAVKADIEHHLEMATDPEFDLAYEVTELYREKARLEQDVKDLQTRRKRVLGEIARLQSEAKKLKDEVRHQKRLASLREREFEDRLAANPEAALALFSTDEDIRSNVAEDDW